MGLALAPGMTVIGIRMQATHNLPDPGEIDFGSSTMAKRREEKVGESTALALSKLAS